MCRFLSTILFRQVLQRTYRPVPNRFLALGIGLFWHLTVGFSQVKTDLDKTVYVVVEQQPSFPGDLAALRKYLAANLHTPPEASKSGVNGRVFVSFIVNTDGSIHDVGVTKGLGYGCDEEAVRVVSAMPCWIPGSQSGRLVRVKYVLPIPFGVDSSKRRDR